MDINSMNTYNTTAFTQALENTSKYEETTSKNYAGATDEELMDACKEFEAYFLEQMFKSMQKMIPTSESESSSNKMLTDYYKEQLTAEYATTATDNGDGVGIAKMLFEQMKRNYDL